MVTLQRYIAAFSSLHTAKVRGQRAPHKAVLLLAVIDLIEEGFISSPQIPLTEELNRKFLAIWRRYVGASAVFTPDLCKPYYHMQYEPFWRLVERSEVEYGTAAEPSPYVLSKKERKDLPGGHYSAESMRRAFAYAEIDGMLFQLLQSCDARATLRVVLISTYFA